MIVSPPLEGVSQIRSEYLFERTRSNLIQMYMGHGKRFQHIMSVSKLIKCQEGY